MDRLRSSRATEWAVVGAAGIVGALLLGFVFPALHHPVSLLLAPLAAIGIRRAAAMPWSPWELALLCATVIALLGFLVSPSYIGRIGR
jgi:hypothetical protein